MINDDEYDNEDESSLSNDLSEKEVLQKKEKEKHRS